MYKILEINNDPETIKNVKQELSGIDLKHFSVNTSSYSDAKFIQTIWYSEVIFITQSIQEAKSIITGIETNPLKINKNQHEKLYKAIIFSVNEKEKNSFEGAFEYLKEAWLFMNSDKVTFNGSEIKAERRGVAINPFINKMDFTQFYDKDKWYSGTMNNAKIQEIDFINNIISWIVKQLKTPDLHETNKRKYKEFNEYLTTRKETNTKNEEPSTLDKLNEKKILEIFSEFEVENFFNEKKHFNYLVNILVEFFTTEDYNSIDIKLKQRKKTNLARALRKIHESLSKKETLKQDVKFFELIRNIDSFAKSNNKTIYSLLTK